MKMTSAEANKFLRKLHDDHSALESMEMESRTFVAATTEKLEDARPEYDYTAVQEKLAELEDKARRVKHAINNFNISQAIDDSGMTIDQALVYIPQLSERKRKLAIMRAAQKKKRNESMKSSNLIEYTYANYDIEQAEADYQSTSDELARVQNALDLIRLSEDQFVHWAYHDLTPDGFPKKNAPCVHEQYHYEMPVDNSSCNVANAWLDLYEHTGDKLAFAKAKALIDNITIQQNAVNGKIPTTFEWREAGKDRKRTFWINCSFSSVTTLLRFASMIE